MLRKYMSEFGMHTFSSHVAISYPVDLQSIKKGPKYHIYMINRIPKLTFIPESLIIKKEGFSVDINYRTETKNRNKTINIFLTEYIDHSLFEYTFDKPLKSLTIQDKHGNGISLRVLVLYLREIGKLQCEVVYIGKSFGKKGERDAFTRLQSHDTFQRIQSEHLFQSLESDLAFTLWEFTPRLITSFDGITENFEKSMEEDEQHMMDILENPPLEIDEQLINITEAALINYFKPEYNNKFKNNFPDFTHSGYKYYFNMDFNSIIVELDPTAINIEVYSKERNYNIYDPIKYTLHPENVRKSMFDIFTEKNSFKK